ncbi:MAG TPA: VIT family protein [Ktedonobacterales bacterium]|nr:VIT family protein [Ktedonobacterales bacterium]
MSTTTPQLARTRGSLAIRLLLRVVAPHRREQRRLMVANAPTGGKVPSQTARPDEATRSFILRIVQPGLAGLMDGSVSTLAPLFATAFVTHSPFKAFLVGMAAATGAGISMAFAEALSDDGAWTGRGKPWLRGGVIGVMTFIGGSLHTLPFLLPTLQMALAAAYVVVATELVVIALIRRRFFGTHWGLSIFQVMGSGALVFMAALVFGNM